MAIAIATATAEATYDSTSNKLVEAVVTAVAASTIDGAVGSLAPVKDWTRKHQHEQPSIQMTE